MTAAPAALVTGGSSGIGLAIARMLCHEGYGLTLVSAPIEQQADKLIALQFDVNVWSVMRFYRAALPMLRAAAAERGSSLVINTASVSGKAPEALLSAYSASKAAVVPSAMR